MTESKKNQELARISASLSEAVRSAEPEEWRQIVRKTIRQLDEVIERSEAARAKQGKKTKKPRAKI
jgi:hypothetical protein